MTLLCQKGTIKWKKGVAISRIQSEDSPCCKIPMDPLGEQWNNRRWWSRCRLEHSFNRQEFLPVLIEIGGDLGVMK